MGCVAGGSGFCSGFAGWADADGFFPTFDAVGHASVSDVLDGER